MLRTLNLPQHLRRRAILVLVVAAGLGMALRFAGLPIPGAIAKYGGDCVWAAAWASGLLAIWPRIGPARACWAALAIAITIECFQATGIPARLASQGFVVRLLLGTTFGWWEFPSYAAGTLAAGLALWPRNTPWSSRRVWTR